VSLKSASPIEVKSGAGDEAVEASGGGEGELRCCGGALGHFKLLMPRTCPSCGRRKQHLIRRTGNYLCNNPTWEVVWIDGLCIRMYATKQQWKNSAYQERRKKAKMNLRAGDAFVARERFATMK
jgi:hypothetical protein